MTDQPTVSPPPIVGAAPAVQDDGGPGGGASLVPVWLSNIAALGWRVLVVAALAVVSWYVLTLLWTVTASILVAVIVSAVFAPFVLRLRARGRSRTAAAAIVWATAILIISLVLLLLVLAFLPYLQVLVAAIKDGMGSLQAQLADLQVPAAVSDAAQAAMTCDHGRGRPGRGQHRRCRRGSVHRRHPRYVPGVLLPARRRQGLAVALPGCQRAEA